MNNNYSSKEVIEFIKNNKDSLSEEDIRFLLYYYRNIKKGKDISSDLSLKVLLDDAKKVKEYMDSINTTEILEKRYKDLDTVLDYINNKEDNNRISYLLDKLYYENNLGVREHSNLIFQLKNNRKGVNKNEGK